MKRFVFEYLFIAVLVAAQCGVIYWQGHDYVHDSNNLYKYNYIHQHGNEIKTLILGHSQAANGINPWVMGDSVFNMAEPSRILYYDKEILTRNIHFMPNLKIVIYPLLYQIDNGAFFTQEGFRGFAIKEYKRTMRINAPYEFRGVSDEPTLSEILSIHHFASSKECDSLGYITMGDGFSDTKDYIDIEVNEDSIVAMLRAMAETCEEHGIRFIVVMEPCTNTFNSQTVDLTRLAMIDRIIDSVREKYPMEYHDYLNHPNFRSIELFHSQTHLNHKGATLFAERIKDDCWL